MRLEDYPRLLKAAYDIADEQERVGHLRYLMRTDLYFLLRYGCARKDMENPWLFDRCQEVQASPNGYLDLWSREHYKSTIITFGQSLQDILSSHGNDPLPKWNGREVTIGIFSHTRPIAKAFLRQLKQEFESNELLKYLFPDILWQRPEAEAPIWSEDSGLVMRRRSNPKEATIEAWGLVDGQPTSKHFVILVYDDVVTLTSVTSPEMIAKTTAALELSYNLGVTEGGIRRAIGTRYHYNDSYRTLIKRDTFQPRLYPATDDGTLAGVPVFWTVEQFRKKVRDYGPYTAACQLLQNPKADTQQGFKREWLRYYQQHNSGAGMNVYILVDPASEKKKGSDYTAIAVIGLAPDRNYYLLDFVRDRLNLKERTAELFRLHLKWHPRGVGYEKYGKDADIEHIQYVMELDNYRFDITPLGGTMAKTDRIKRLIPLFADGRFYFPAHLYRTLYDGHEVDLINVLVEDEYDPFPVPIHDDGLDVISRIEDPDMNVVWPQKATTPPPAKRAPSAFVR